jgi:acyl-CoA thioester hydrolase
MKTHEFFRRIYYHDTDTGGVVYHTNYLVFMEAARCEWFIDLGYDLHTGLPMFVARHVSVDYISPARFGDYLKITSTVTETGHTSFVVHHDVYKADTDTLLCQADVRLVHIDEKFKPTRIPGPIAKEKNT